MPTNKQRVTDIYVFTFFSSGMPYRYHDSLDVKAEDVIHHNLYNNRTRPIENGTNLFLMKASSVNHVTTSGRRLSQARTKIPEEMDLKKIDMSEEVIL